MSLVNWFVSALLTSRFHPLMSRSIALVSYTGRRSGGVVTTPTQYVQHGDDVVILVGHHETKSWWRNFLDHRDLQVLVQGNWLAMRAQSVIGADEPDVVASLLDTYLRRFPKAARSLGAGTSRDRARRAVVVWCQLRHCPGTAPNA